MRFKVTTSAENYRIESLDLNGSKLMGIDASLTDRLSSESVFENLEEISLFFKEGNVAWSPSNKISSYDAVEFKTKDWLMSPLKVKSEFTSYFLDQDAFPDGSVHFDSAMIMRNIQHSWINQECFQCVA